MATADLVITLAKHEVEFIIVGGMAAILRGTPVSTFDLDVVYERSAANIERLLSASVSGLNPPAEREVTGKRRDFRVTGKVRVQGGSKTDEEMLYRVKHHWHK